MSYDHKLVDRLRNGKDEVIDAKTKKKIANEITFLDGELENLDAVNELLGNQLSSTKVQLAESQKRIHELEIQIDQLQWENKGIAEWREIALTSQAQLKDVRAVFEVASEWFDEYTPQEVLLAVADELAKPNYADITSEFRSMSK